MLTVATGLASCEMRGVRQQPAVTSWVQPMAGWQASTVQTSWSLQEGAMPGLQTPPWQVSRPLHKSLSSHGAPLTVAGQMMFSDWVAFARPAACAVNVG